MWFVLLVARMVKAAHRRANTVLKYLRWRSSSPEGEVADGFKKGIASIVRPMVRSPSLTSCLGLALNEGKQAIGEKLGLRGIGGIG